MIKRRTAMLVLLLVKPARRRGIPGVLPRRLSTNEWITMGILISAIPIGNAS